MSTLPASAPFPPREINDVAILLQHARKGHLGKSSTFVVQRPIPRGEPIVPPIDVGNEESTSSSQGNTTYTKKSV